jgi:hypothetical protein
MSSTTNKEEARNGKKVLKEAKCNRDSIIQFFVGDRIGKGASRSVYHLYFDPCCVLKVEHRGGTFHNVMEWKVWEAVKDTDIADWFAPCMNIDSMGNVMTQKRTVPFRDADEFNQAIEKYRGGMIPSFLDDIHYGNFGWLDGMPVCHDYGYNNILANAHKFEWSVHEHSAVKRAQKSFNFDNTRRK